MNKLVLTLRGLIILFLMIFIARNSMITGSTITGVAIGLGILGATWIQRKIISKPVRTVELVSIDSKGDPVGTGKTLNKEDQDRIVLAFDKKAGWFLEEDFEFSDYALVIYSEGKNLFLYPDRRNKQVFRVTKHIFGIELDQESFDVINGIIGKYF